MISYEIPMGLCLLCVILAAGSVRPYEIVSQQLAGGEWFIIHLPIVAILFFICLLAESNRAPFDLAEAEQELIGGWHTEYSSLKWALFFMGEYIHMVVGAAFFTLLFLGGWSLNPLGIGWDLPMSGGILLILLQLGVILGKVFALVFLVMMIRWHQQNCNHGKQARSTPEDRQEENQQQQQPGEQRDADVEEALFRDRGKDESGRESRHWSAA